MTRPGQVDLKDLKAGIDIIDLARDLGLEVKRRQARCYNAGAHKHGDKNYSMGFYIDQRGTPRYKCFGCDKRGTAIDLYAEVKGVSTGEAIKALSGRYMTPGKTKMQTYTKQKENKADQALFYQIYETLIFLCLEQGLSQESRNYLTRRGITDEAIGRFLICDIADYGKADRYLKEKFKAEDLSRAGIVGEKGNLIFYKHKLLFPFLEGADIVFIQGRRLDDEPPKYLHIKGRPVPMYNKSILTEMTKGDKVYICEGIIDAITLEIAGYNAVGILGVNNFKPEMIEDLKGFKRVIMLDNDPAGQAGIEKIAKQFTDRGQGVSKKLLPPGVKDINEYFMTRGKSGAIQN